MSSTHSKLLPLQRLRQPVCQPAAAARWVPQQQRSGAPGNPHVALSLLALLLRPLRSTLRRCATI